MALGPCSEAPQLSEMHIFSVGLRRDQFGMGATRVTFRPDTLRATGHPDEYRLSTAGNTVHAVAAFDKRLVVLDELKRQGLLRGAGLETSYWKRVSQLERTLRLITLSTKDRTDTGKHTSVA